LLRLAPELDAVLRFVEDLDLWMIRAEMALPAVFWRSRKCRAERMPPVASCTATAAAIRIHAPAPNSAIRPCRRVKFASAHKFDLTAVALPASVGRRRTALGNFAQHVIERSDELLLPAHDDSSQTAPPPSYDRGHISSASRSRRSHAHSGQTLRDPFRSRDDTNSNPHVCWRGHFPAICSTIPGVRLLWQSRQA